MSNFTDHNKSDLLFAISYLGLTYGPTMLADLEHFDTFIQHFENTAESFVSAELFILAAAQESFIITAP